MYCFPVPQNSLGCTRRRRIIWEEIRLERDAAGYADVKQVYFPAKGGRQQRAVSRVAAQAHLYVPTRRPLGANTMHVLYKLPSSLRSGIEPPNSQTLLSCVRRISSTVCAMCSGGAPWLPWRARHRTAAPRPRPRRTRQSAASRNCFVSKRRGDGKVADGEEVTNGKRQRLGEGGADGLLKHSGSATRRAPEEGVREEAF